MRRDRKVQKRYQEPFIFWLYHYSRLLSVRPVAAVMVWLFLWKTKKVEGVVFRPNSKWPNVVDLAPKKNNKEGIFLAWLGFCLSCCTAIL